MTDQSPFPLQGTSAAFEQAALAKFKALLVILPPDCRVYREIWDQSTVLCLDFCRCPGQLAGMQDQVVMLLLAANHLGLAQAISFRIGQKIKGWKSLTSTNI
ncbi:MAG: hypothetical protein HC799_05050 [Limnothrix sp. RL_2_0]|nr:hypothetical protein [Limnothrix sp. RL_2_0]